MAEKRQLTRRGRERRDKLMSYAIARFAENGFHPTSVSDIVTGVGVGKGVFYWYFESKDQLLKEILRDALRDLRTTQAEAMIDANEPLQQLEAAIRASIGWSASNPDITRLVLFGWSEAGFAQVLRQGVRLIEQAAAKGQVAPGNPTMMALAIRAVIDQLAREYAVGDGPVEQEMVETTVRMCMRGVQG